MSTDATHSAESDTAVEESDPVLFDVGVVALAHSGTPMSGTALGYVREAVRGEIDAVVPYSVLVGAHHILHLDYGFSRDAATYVLTNFADARRVHWYAGPGDSDIREGLDLAGEHNIDGWDGYYAHVARATGATTVIGLDDDFERVAGLTVEIPLTDDEREQLHKYLAG
jgi:predicted nucleic acid-binding protein